MSHHEETFAVDVPEDCDAPQERLAEFYRHNGYSHTAGTDDGCTFARGKRGASWWSSDMSELKTDVAIDLDGDSGQIAYRVETTGQHLTDEDRAFWNREAKAACDYLHDRTDLVDLRPAEARRAKKITQEYRFFGLQAAVFIVLAIVAAGIVGAHLGFL